MAIGLGILGCLQATNVAGGGSGFTNIALMNDLGSKMEQNMIETSVMCATAAYVSRMGGIQKVTYSASGYWDDYGDTTGQKIVLDNVANGAELWFRYYYAGSVVGQYVKSQAMVESFEIKTTPDGTVDVSFSAQSTGVITHA